MTFSRRELERRVGPLVVLLSGLPRAVPFLVVAVLLVGGLALQGVAGAVLLLVLAAALSALLALSWPTLHPGPRVLRLGVLALLVGRAVVFLR